MILIHTDHAANMDRWYSVDVQPTLFSDRAVVCRWGSRRNTYQRIRVVTLMKGQRAEDVAQTMVARKMRRGYVPV